MSASPIEWTEHTWNPMRGCSRVSEGCRKCYAERRAARFSGVFVLPSGQVVKGPFSGFAQMTPSGPRWTGKVELIESMLDIPLRRKKPTVYFVNSMSDMFHEKLTDEAIDRVFAVMALCPQHTFQCLTKRAGRMEQWVRGVNGAERFHDINIAAQFQTRNPHYGAVLPTQSDGMVSGGWPLPNVHLGVSVEDQPTADERIPHLLRTPAAVRFVSYEPALGPVDFTPWFDGGMECNYCNEWRGTEKTAAPDCKEDDKGDDPGWLCPRCGEAVAHIPLDERLDQIIIGGESGPGARPFDIQWARNTIAQCKAAGVACFVKQVGAYVIQDGERRIKRDRKGGDMSEWPHDIRVRMRPGDLWKDIAA